MLTTSSIGTHGSFSTISCKEEIDHWVIYNTCTSVLLIVQLYWFQKCVHRNETLLIHIMYYTVGLRVHHVRERRLRSPEKDLSLTWCTHKPTVYLHHHASRHLQAASISCIVSKFYISILHLCTCNIVCLEPQWHWSILLWHGVNALGPPNRRHAKCVH